MSIEEAVAMVRNTVVIHPRGGTEHPIVVAPIHGRVMLAIDLPALLMEPEVAEQLGMALIDAAGADRAELARAAYNKVQVSNDLEAGAEDHPSGPSSPG